MRVFLIASWSSLAFCGLAEAAPKRVASLNLCTDELLLLIAEPGQIVSVTHLAQSPAETSLWKQGRRYRRNDGSLVSVTSLRPDLVLTMGGGARDRIRIAERLGIRTLELPFPQSVNDIALSVTRVAGALGRPRQGKAIVNRLSRLKVTMPSRASDTIWLGGGGRSVAATGLAAQWMRLGGFRQRPLRGDRVSLEQLLVKPPETLLRSDYRSGQYSGEQRWLSHPLAGGTRRSHIVHTDGRPWTCLGPLMVDEIARLRGQK